MSVYGLLDLDARGWPHHQKLRDAGRIAEARRQERLVIRMHAESIQSCLKGGGYLSIGIVGWTLHISQHRRVSGNSWFDGLVLAARAAGVPTINIMGITNENLVKYWKLPMIGFPGEIDDAWYLSVHRAPFEYVAWRALELGAVVENVNIPPALLKE